MLRGGSLHVIQPLELCLKLLEAGPSKLERRLVTTHGLALGRGSVGCTALDPQRRCNRLVEICRGVSHDRETWRTLGLKIDAAVNHEIGGGERLTLIETAKTDARVLAEKKGCDSEDAAALLKEYDALVGA